MTSEQYEKWANENDIFISKVYYRITFKGMGLYILNSFKFKLFPKFFYMNGKYFTECGFNWLGWIFEFQWNR
ncbi:MAG: hypothetical protein EBR82_49420 [Caulobacteraceae bacterium]|nr:hypothetical protein [Caulobacteraceae bacterium]